MNKGFFLREYITSKKEGMLLAFFCLSLAGITLYLLSVDAGKIIYPLTLCATALWIYGCYDFVRFHRKHRMLLRALSNIDVTMGELPEAGGQIEDDYRMLLVRLSDRKDAQIASLQNAQSDMSEYVTLWTHQIKTPVTAMRLLTENASGEDKQEMMMRLFEIEQYCDLMLSFLRLEGESTDYLFQEYPVKSMVNQAVKYFARIFLAKGISVKVDIPESCSIVTDEKWLVFVLKQLISNALKYTKKGSITITMEPGSGILRITDTGIGINSQDLPRIFERGYTGYNGRMDKKATGLGLFLSKSILTQLNHRINIISEVDAGTTVEIYI